MREHPLVYVVLLNWNGREDTIAAIQSLLLQEYPRQRILVVDNASTDGSVESIAGTFGDVVEIVANESNLGFTGGNNVGIRYALDRGADYVLLLNNDTVAHDRLLVTKLVSAIETDPAIGLACPTIYYEVQPEKPWYAGARYSLWRGGGKHFQVLPESTQCLIDTGYATGCCVLASRRLVERIGLLDEDFYLYHEDVDWSLRARKAGFRVIYVPHAALLHKVSRSARDTTGRGAYSPRVVYYKFRNRILLVRKHGNSIQKYFLWPLYIARDVIWHGFAYTVLQRWEKLRAMVTGVTDGLRLRVS